MAEGRAPSPWAYLPFGAGPHVCMGASLAALEIRLTLAMLLQLPRQRVASPPRIEGDIRELFEAPAGA